MMSHKRFIALMAFLFLAGKSFITDGERGGGKTHHAIATAHYLLTHPEGPWGRTVMLTNIIFQERTEDGLRLNFPENVYHIDSLKSMFRTIGMVKKQFNNKVRILIVLDETQFFMLSDRNSEDVNIAMIQWMAIARKLGCITWLITPSRGNLVPRIRNYYNDDKPGYTTGIFAKDIPRARRAIERYKLNAQPRDFTTIQYGKHGRPRLIPIPPDCPWCKEVDEMEVGDISYDHLSCADLEMGDGFVLKPFSKAISSILSAQYADIITQYFEALDKGPEGMEENLSVGQLLIREKMLISDELKKLSLSEAKISAAVHMSTSTWRRYYTTFLTQKEADSNGAMA